MATTPELIAPADGATSRLGSIVFSWQPVDGGADLYTLQIATDIAFAHIAHQAETAARQIESTFPAGNLYYWRVIARVGSSSYTSTTSRVFSAPPFIPVQNTSHVEDGLDRVISQFQENA